MSVILEKLFPVSILSGAIVAVSIAIPAYVYLSNENNDREKHFISIFEKSITGNKALTAKIDDMQKQIHVYELQSQSSSERLSILQDVLKAQEAKIRELSHRVRELEGRVK